MLAALAFFAVACGGDEDGGAPPTTATQPSERLSGTVEVDGSSTVFPISEAMAEEFGKEARDVRVTVGVSGPGGGFKRFCSGETDINDASRPIRDSEAQACGDAGVEWTELKIAFDGLSVLVNPDNDFVDCLTVEELKRVWEPDSRMKSWNGVRPEFPDQHLSLYGPGTDSGTFDYFTEAIVGKEDASRSDYTASEDDNTLVQGVAGDKGALGYFGFAYYEENSDKLKLVAVDGGSGCVLPSAETIRNGTYAPLSRPLFLYVKKAALQRPEVASFLRFYLENASLLVEDVGYVPLPDADYQEGLTALEEANP